MTTGWINRCRSSASRWVRRLIGREQTPPGPWPWLRAGDADSISIDQFDSQPVLVLAPHPDDEVIGPGGAVRRHVLAGAPVAVVVLTDGKWGGYDPDHTLCQRRKAESIRAAQILGTQAPVFLDAPDGNLSETREILDALQKIIRKHQPKYIYLPALTDQHHDHWATNSILNMLLAQLPPDVALRLIIRGYEVWTPLPANRLVDITAVADLKRQAINAFTSQVSTYDYAGAILGLNHYRSLQSLRGHGFAEALMEISADDFRQYFRLLRGQ
jgi:LmbE family N-acetylglucosaminyl deacetylase